MKHICDMTKKEFLELENFNPVGDFYEIIIVPTNEIHDSGFRCMKFILCNGMKIVGVVSGWSDVMHFDGIGGYGKNLKWYDNPSYRSGAYSIDCLPKSRLIRVMSEQPLELDDFIGSSFMFYRKEK